MISTRLDFLAHSKAQSAPQHSETVHLLMSCDRSWRLSALKTRIEAFWFHAGTCCLTFIRDNTFNWLHVWWQTLEVSLQHNRPLSRQVNLLEGSSYLKMFHLTSQV